MGSRLKLHEELKSVLGSNNVYFNPPKLLKYPCIVYKFHSVDNKKADDRSYIRTNQYDITVIDTNLDSQIYLDIMDHFKMCSHNIDHITDNLRHDELTIYY